MGAIQAFPALSDLQFLFQFFQLCQPNQISLFQSNSIIKELEEPREPKASEEWEISRELGEVEKLEM